MELFSGIKNLYTFQGMLNTPMKDLTDLDFSAIRNGAFIVNGGRYVWVGAQAEIPGELSKKIQKETKLDCESVFPAFTECHTHLVFAGDRSKEFDERICGKSYQQIAQEGGGINSTVEATRMASYEELLKLSQHRADRFARQGVALLEVKSGYGLNLVSEVKLLKVAKALKGPEIVSTFLGAHSVPAGVSLEAYFQDVVDNQLPEIARLKLASRVDIFIEKGFFNLQQARALFEKAKALGLQIVCHSEQLSRMGSVDLAIQHGAVSCDHLVCMSVEDVRNFGSSGAIAVLLPTSDLYLGINYPNAQGFMDAGAKVALATDFNPGSSPTQDLSLVGVLARLKMKMSLPQVFCAYTVNAALALSRTDCGAIKENFTANFFTTGSKPGDFFYSIGVHPVSSVFVKGSSLF
ncbi:MAG: imidazolonepropionase [Bdellovibrionales bacterium CG10_big_fil_rev_8_21_14_0_10_45_34]|nr:MAG: imidazolonepropionase [Bdellovibrionales bacterium CG10_big_fil_rev_8_21_14_0_10_45_34]